MENEEEEDRCTRNEVLSLGLGINIYKMSSGKAEKGNNLWLTTRAVNWLIRGINRRN